MQVATTGLVLRQVKVGEADRILTILTPDLGVVSASARGSLRMKSALFSATGLFCYSEFTLTSGRSHYFVDTAQVKKVFHGISASIEGMALASYMAEIAAELSPAPPEADAQLRLLLNCLYMISERHYPCAQLKAIYELRALTLAGYMPDVLACAGCGKYDGGDFYLDPVEGRLLCADCAEKAHHITNLDNGALYALRKRLAAKQKLPAYMVFNDSTLRQMALKKPLSVEELLNIPGVGEKKAARYGQEFLSVIEETVGTR